jgi:hypothetical protein
MIIAQITDFHVRPPAGVAYGGIDTNAMLCAAGRAHRGARSGARLRDRDRRSHRLRPAEEYAVVEETLAQLPCRRSSSRQPRPARDHARVAGALASLPHTGSRFLHYVIDDFPCG